MINFDPSNLLMEKPDKKSNILIAAEKLFSELGYEGTSTRQIAKEAGANMSMINYYFGSKEGVFLEIMSGRLQTFSEQLAIIDANPVAPKEKLMQIIEMQVDRVMSNVAFHKMMHRELSMSQRPEMYCKLKDAMSSNLNLIERIINEGITAGTFRKLDIRMLIATIMGTITSVATMPSKVTQGAVLDISIPADREILTQRLITHLKDLVTNHITPQK